MHLSSTGPVAQGTMIGILAHRMWERENLKLAQHRECFVNNCTQLPPSFRNLTEGLFSLPPLLSSEVTGTLYYNSLSHQGQSVAFLCVLSQSGLFTFTGQSQGLPLPEIPHKRAASFPRSCTEPLPCLYTQEEGE